MGDAEQRNCTNQDDLIAKAIVDNFSKCAQKPSGTNERSSCLRGKSSLDKSTSCFNDWSKLSKCFSGNGLQSRTSTACTTGSHFMLGGNRQPSASNVNSSALRSRQSSIFRGMHSDDSRFSASSSKGFSSGFCCQQRSLPRVSGGLGGTTQCKLGSDDCRFSSEDDGCGGLGGTRNASDMCCDLESDNRGFAPFRGFGGSQMQSKPDVSQSPDYCFKQNAKVSSLDECLRVVRDTPRRQNNDCFGMNGGDSLSSSEPFRLGGDDLCGTTDASSFRSVGADLCGDQEDNCGFGSGPMRSLGATSMRSSGGAAYNSFNPGQTSQFASDPCRTKVDNRTTDYCQLGNDDCGLGGDDCSALDSGRQADGGSQFASIFGSPSMEQTTGGSQFVPNSFRPSTSGYSAFPSAASAADNSSCSHDLCKDICASSSFSPDSCDTNSQQGPGFCSDSFKSVDKAQNCQTDRFKSNGDNCGFADSFSRVDKTSNFASNLCRQNDECSDFCTESPRSTDNACDFTSNSLRPNSEGSQFISSSFRPTDKGRDFTSNSLRPNSEGNPFISNSFRPPDKGRDFASNSFRPNTEGNPFISNSFRPPDKTLDFASNSLRSNDDCSNICSNKDCDFTSNSFRPNTEGSQFISNSFRPPDKALDFTSNSFRPNTEGSHFISGSFRPPDKALDFTSNSPRSNDDCSNFRSDTVCDFTSNAPSNSFRPNDECSEDFCSDKACEFSSNQFRPNGDGSQFRPNGDGSQFRPNGDGSQFNPGSYGSPDQSCDFTTNQFRPNDECSEDFCSEKACDFASNQFRPGGEGPQFMSDPFRQADFPPNSFRPSGEGQNCQEDPCAQNAGPTDCFGTNNMCGMNMKDDWDDQRCLADMCGMGIDEWFAVSPSLQKVVANLASQSVLKGSDEILKDLIRLKAANILPPDFVIPGEEQGSMKCGAQAAEATASQLKLTAERLVEHIVCRAAKIEAAGDENIDLSECDVYLEDVVKKISSIICKATIQQQQQQQQQAQKRQSQTQQQTQRQSQAQRQSQPKRLSQPKPPQEGVDSGPDSGADTGADTGPDTGPDSAPESAPESQAVSKEGSPSASEASIVSGNESANNSAIKSRRQIHDSICDTLMQNCFDLLGVDAGSLQDIEDLADLKDSVDLRSAAKILSASGMTWQNVNNSQGFDGTPTGSLSLSNSSLSRSVASNSAASNSSAQSSAASNSAASNSALSKSAASNSTGSKQSMSNPAAPNSTNAASVDTAEKRSSKPQVSVTNKDLQGPLPEARSSGQNAEKVKDQASAVVEKRDSKLRSDQSMKSVGDLGEISSSALPPTTFLELESPEPVPEEKPTRRDSMDTAILRMLEASLEDCTKLAVNAELRWFVMEVVYSLYSTVRTKLEKILKQQAKDARPGTLSEPVEKILGNADEEIREIVLPAVIDHIVWVLRQDAKQRGGQVNYETAKALAGGYVDTIVTNAVLKLETDGKIRRPRAKMFVVTSNDARFKRNGPLPPPRPTRPPPQPPQDVIVTPASAIRLAPKHRSVHSVSLSQPSTTSADRSAASTSTGSNEHEMSPASKTSTELELEGLTQPPATETEQSLVSEAPTSTPSTTGSSLSPRSETSSRSGDSTKRRSNSRFSSKHSVPNI